MDRAAPDQLSISLNKLPGGHKWSKTSCEDNLGNWRNWCDSRTSKSVASGKSFMDTWTTGSLVFSWNINMELASCATSYWLTISTESGSCSWTYPTYNWEYVASVHEGKKPLKCDICDHRCCQKSDMNKYVAIPSSWKKKAVLLWHLWVQLISKESNE